MRFLSPEDLPDPGVEPWSRALQADSVPFELQESPTQSSAVSQTGRKFKKRGYMYT